MLVKFAMLACIKIAPVVDSFVADTHPLIVRKVDL